MSTAKDTIKGALGTAAPHDSGHLHVTGQAVYTDDLPELRGTLYAATGVSGRAHARLVDVDLDAVARAPGVAAVLTAADIPGRNDCGAVASDEPILAEGEVCFAGQPVFAVAARSIREARRAVRAARIEYEDLPAYLDVEQALAAGSFIEPSTRLQRGDPRAAIEAAPHRLSGRLEIGGQEQFYLEGQIAYAVPREDRSMLVYSSTQHPAEVQHQVAHALGLDSKDVQVQCRRMGGAFGGKESQPAQFACIAALLARRTERPVKLRLDRDDDMVLTGKRHPFRTDYEVGFDAQGRILGIEFTLASQCGYAADLSSAVNDRAVFHCDNCYYLENIGITSHRCRTHTVSNTAFRGFGGPQGMLGIEYVIDEIAGALGADPLEVRRRNFYGRRTRNRTHYHQPLRDNVIADLAAQLEARAAYRERRAALAGINRENPVLKRGIAFTPVKFGIAFTATHLNQAGALVSIYQDGSVLLSHGGLEMGQGLFVKVAQVVAEELQVDIDRIRSAATDTEKVPNTSATAASSGADLNGRAARRAAGTLKRRLARFAAGHFGVPQAQIRFENNRVIAGNHALAFAELVKMAYMARISLSATGFYRTPKIGYDREHWRGMPFFYFCYGAAVAEVLVDTLTGEYRIERVDILHDVGRSLNPAIDLGQIEGGFIQGAGWLTTEELCWDAAGKLTTHAPSTYKIPVAGDAPPVFNVALYAAGKNVEDVVHRSKAVGEPPLMLAMSVFFAIKDALAHAAGRPVHLDAPATPERVLAALQAPR